MTEEYINQNKTDTFQKGNTVVMHICHESTLDQYIGKLWECLTDSYLDKGGKEYVHLKGFSGAFFCEYLHFVNPQK